MRATQILPLVLFAAGITRAAEPTFSKDIAPIFQARCQICHHPGAIGPMSLLTYEDTRPWVKSIRKAVGERTMPPWHADEHYGKFANDRRLSQAEYDTILAWITAGAPQGDAKDMPPPLKFEEGWLIGNPDAIFTMPEEWEVAADIEDQHKVFSVPTNFTEDKWVDAIEFHPGNPAVVHHIIASPIGGWAPGNQPHIFPEGMGRMIPKGTVVRFQMHYHKDKGTAMKDRSSIGVRFAKGPIHQEVHGAGIPNFTFTIPPEAANVPVHAEFALDHDAHIRSFMPHMHLRGKSMKFTAVYPDGKSEILLNVPKYDFNWQTTYEFAEPVSAAKGTKILVDASFDNSTSNPVNPDPKATVWWGPETTDEMMIGFMEFVFDGEDIAAGKAVPYRRGGIFGEGRGAEGLSEKLGGLGGGRDQQQEGDPRHVAATLVALHGLEDAVVVDAAERPEDQERGEEQTDVADRIHDERLDAGRRILRLLEPEGDQEV
ncbi:hypothetical protein HYR69_03130, partial [Candidatus Sumerlaeota bacterium]|nr:hypothetical protein [Candidatus Sumerlaeota bacterium]